MLVVEQDRQRYLAQLGVTQWYARQHLPGAGPSPKFEFAEIVTPARSIPSSQIRAPAQAEKSVPRRPVPVDVAAVASALKAPAQPPSGKTEKETPASIGSNSKTSTDTDFDISPLSLAKVTAGKVILIAELDTDERRREQELSLLLNIAKAVSGPEESGEIDQFSWPPLPQANLPGHTRQMKEALLQRWILAEAGMSRVYMGQETPALKVQNKSMQLTSLGSMLREPAQKKEVWRRLSQFVQSVE